MKNEKSKTNQGLTNILTYLLIGGGIGAALALLFAPKSGQEFRGDIAEKARQGLDKTEELAGEFGEKANAVYQDTKTKAVEIYGSAMHKIEDTAAKIEEIPEIIENAVKAKEEKIIAAYSAGQK